MITIFEGGHLEMSTAARPGVTQELTPDYVREVFKNLESGDGKEFFDHVADNVDWTVEGTHPLAGHYHSKAEFLAHTFEKLSKVLPKGAELYTEHLLVSGDWAVVELHSKAIAKNRFKFDNRYCWICRFVNGTIVEVRAYLDSVLVARLFEENPI
jgi:ketosteroid isomerase-like protein